MLAYLRSVTLLARALDTFMGADGSALAYLALAPAAVMLAHLRSATLLALALLTVVMADSGAPAYLARTCTSCTCSSCNYARISPIRHTPCTCSFHACGGRCWRPRIPCTHSFCASATLLVRALFMHVGEDAGAPVYLALTGSFFISAISHTPCTCSFDTL